MLCVWLDDICSVSSPVRLVGVNSAGSTERRESEREWRKRFAKGTGARSAQGLEQPPRSNMDRGRAAAGPPQARELASVASVSITVPSFGCSRLSYLLLSFELTDRTPHTLVRVAFSHGMDRARNACPRKWGGSFEFETLVLPPHFPSRPYVQFRRNGHWRVTGLSILL